MHLRIQTYLSRFGYELASELEASGVGTVEVYSGPTTVFELRHKPTVTGAEISRLLDALKPLHPTSILPDPELELADVQLMLGDDKPLNTWEVKIEADSPELSARVRDTCDDLGFRDLGGSIGVQEADTLTFSGASVFARQVLRWHLKRMGLKVKEVRHTSWSDEDDDIWLSLRDPALAGKPFIQRFDVAVSTDDPDRGEKLIRWLTDAGFRCRPLAPLTADLARDRPFALTPGPFGNDRAPSDLARLTTLIEDLMTEARIDRTRYPLKVLGDSDGDCAQIVLPFRACAGGEKKPYSGPYPERFTIRIHTDDKEGIARLVKRFTDAGFANVETVDADADDLGRGYALDWGAAAKEPDIAAKIRHEIEEEMTAVGAGPPLELVIAEKFTSDDTDVWIYFPLRGIDDGSLLARLSDPTRFKLTLHSPAPDGWEDLLAEWRRWGFQGCTTENSDNRKPSIDFGGAPAALLDRLKESIRAASDLVPTMTKRWDDTDRDLWVYLPERPDRAGKGAGTWETDAFDLRAWFGAGLIPAAGQVTAFLETTPEKVRIGTIWLSRRAGLREPFTPDANDFAHFCLDARTSETLQHLATSIALREPCLLEGETSTSKTSSILFLAALLNQPVVRINLNGQTDTGELVGRYVPYAENGAKGGLEFNSGAPQTNNPQGTPRNAHVASQWRWQDGPVVTALRRGWWVLLDEVNLAEPQILERMNSVLEREPSLVLTEHDHSAFGSGGQLIHSDFRIFATMNPAEYAGRSILSPAYRDRWRAHRFIPRPGETEYLAMLEFLIYGKQPDVNVMGREYHGAEYPPCLGGLGEWDGIDDLLPALASFHASLESAAGGTDHDPARLGNRRKERYVFTRRGLLSLIEFLAGPFGVAADGPGGKRALREALLRYYLGRVSTPPDQKLIVQLLDAAGLGTGLDARPVLPKPDRSPPPA